MRNGNAEARKIYKSVHKFIPKDDQGRSYDIHHIDGNHNNNNIYNLVAVSIEEHYRIHLQRGDLAAAHRIAGRLQLTHDELSHLAKMRNEKFVREKRHNWQGDGNQQRALNRKRVLDGTHNFLGGREINRQYAEGRPPWGTKEDVSKRTKIQIQQKRHPWQDTIKQRERQLKLLQEGRHASQNKIECPHCKTLGSAGPMKRWHFDNCKQKTL
jgi:hypothetical protein